MVRKSVPEALSLQQSSERTRRRKSRTRTNIDVACKLVAFINACHHGAVCCFPHLKPFTLHPLPLTLCWLAMT